MSSEEQHGSLSQLFGSRSTGESYAKHRPRYPAHIYDRVLAFAALSRLGLAADLGCGSGQVCADLAQRFEQVVGIDASAEQLRRAHQAPNVEYKQCTAEATGLPAQSVDLITAAAALHWCDIPAVYREARRILKPGGAFAAWSYTGHQQELDCPAAQAVWQQLLEQFWPHWHPRLQKLMLRGYEGDEPTSADFGEVRREQLDMQVSMSVAQKLGFIRSWSAYPPYVQQQGQEATDQLLARFEADMVAALGVPDAHTPVQAVMAVDMILARMPLPLHS